MRWESLMNLRKVWGESGTVLEQISFKTPIICPSGNVL